jgi:hypothetical protein
MKTTLSLILLIIVQFVNCFSQFNEKSKSDGQVKYEKPSVYIDYVCQDKHNVQLRMFNNTIWALSIESNQLYNYTSKTIKISNGKEFYAMPNDKVVSLFFQVDKFSLPSKKVNIPKLSRADSSSNNWIASDDSILFSVSTEYLRKDLQIYVKFNYEWELSKSGFIVGSPEHRISFRGIDMPDRLTVCSS